MIFKLNSIILVTFAVAFASSNLFDGVNAASYQQQQLRGAQTYNDSYRQRTMVAVGSDSNFCPKDAPVDGSSCANVLPNGTSSGNCGWQRTSWDGVGTTTTETDHCTCTKKIGNWSCCKEIDTKASPPAPSPPPATVPTAPDVDNFCPSYFPGSNKECALTGMMVGTCYYSSSAQKDEAPNNDSQACFCKDGLFTCSSQPYPKDTTP